MNEKIIRPGVVRKVLDLARSRGHKCTQEAVDNILTAFFDVVKDTISNGDSIHINGFMTIGTQYRKERKARNVLQNIEIVVPPHYRVHIKPGVDLQRAAEEYTKKSITQFGGLRDDNC